MSHICGRGPKEQKTLLIVRLSTLLGLRGAKRRLENQPTIKSSTKVATFTVKFRQLKAAEKVQNSVFQHSGTKTIDIYPLKADICLKMFDSNITHSTTVHCYFKACKIPHFFKVKSKPYLRGHSTTT